MSASSNNTAFRFSSLGLEDEADVSNSAGSHYTASSKGTIIGADNNDAESPTVLRESPGVGVKFNLRSCETCRRRKVKCDRREPCHNCVKAGVDCVFPASGRASRRRRRSTDNELLKRLRRLEAVVDGLGASQKDRNADAHDPTSDRGRDETDLLYDYRTASHQTPLEHGMGRLLIKDDRSRYVASDLWASFGEEISELRNAFNDASSGEDVDVNSDRNIFTADNRERTDHQGFVFGYSSLAFNMTQFRPSPAQIRVLWTMYKENVDPVVKMFHVPTTSNIIDRAATTTDDLSRVHEAVFYSVCFAAVVSAADAQCVQFFGESKPSLMARYRFTAEQALARAQFLNSSSLAVLQSFVLFLQAVRYLDASKAVWSLCSLATSQARAQGLHRDGTYFNLPPFELEMRRRLWWHIFVLNIRASEDHGAEPRLDEQYFDTRLPLNVNDDQLKEDMSQSAREQEGATDMTFNLIRFELSNMQRKLRLLANSSTTQSSMRTIEDRERLIELTQRKMEEKYFSKCDPNNTYLWVASTIGRLVLAKMWLMVHHPRIGDKEDKNADENLKERLFTTSVQVIKFGQLLSSHESTAKWSWLFRTYMQWHIVAYVLSQLCRMPLTPLTEDAWRVLDEKKMSELLRQNRNTLWGPLKLLFEKARRHRDELTRVAGGLCPSVEFLDHDYHDYPSDEPDPMLESTRRMSSGPPPSSAFEALGDRQYPMDFNLEAALGSPAWDETMQPAWYEILEY